MLDGAALDSNDSALDQVADCVALGIGVMVVDGMMDEVGSELVSSDRNSLGDSVDGSCSVESDVG